MKTQPVQILVAIDHEGNWVATGSSFSDSPEEEFKDWIIIDDLSEHMAYRWVTAHIPVPEEVTVEGVVR